MDLRICPPSTSVTVLYAHIIFFILHFSCRHTLRLHLYIQLHLWCLYHSHFLDPTHLKEGISKVCSDIPHFGFMAWMQSKLSVPIQSQVPCPVALRKRFRLVPSLHRGNYISLFCLCLAYRWMSTEWDAPNAQSTPNPGISSVLSEAGLPRGYPWTNTSLGSSPVFLPDKHQVSAF